MALSADRVDHGGVQYTSASFLVGPLIAFGMVGILVLVVAYARALGTEQLTG